MRRKDKELTPAPGDLRIVQAFLNSADLEAGTDELASPRALADWLAGHALFPPGTELTAADLDRMIGFREGLRRFLAEGDRAGSELTETLDRTVASALLQPRFAPGVLRFEPASAGLDGALARLLAILGRAQGKELWSRFKVCASTTCRTAFYDRSNSCGRKWCRPRCGNRLSARASRRRRRRGLR